MTNFDGDGLWPYSLMLAAVVAGLLVSRLVPKWSARLFASALAIFLGSAVIVAVEAVRISDGGIDGGLGLFALVLLVAAVASGFLLMIESLRATSPRDDLHDR